MNSNSGQLKPASPSDELIDRVTKLRTVIDDLRYRYHVLDDPSVTDADYDSLMRELAGYEEQYPDLKTPDSPTQRVGGAPLKKFGQIKHLYPMMSLADAFNAQEMSAWENRLKRLEEKGNFSYYAEIKLDGLAIALVYEAGVLQTGLTRGDGLVGEDVTANIRTIQTIPLRLRSHALVKGRVEVRGEVYMPKKAFERLNQNRAKENLPLFANPRNAAAGSIRQLDSSVTAERPLEFMAFQVLLGEPGQQTILPLHSQEHELAMELGFVSNNHNRLCKDLSAVIKYWQQFEVQRVKLPYQIDGLVVGVNDNQLRKRLGFVGKSPRSIIALKWPAEEVTTLVEEITVNVGRTGALTPVAHLRPVEVAGSTVSRATLHNQDEVTRKDIRVGDTVVIRKAGDIIPEVVKVIKELRPKGTSAYKIPANCPICGTPVTRKPNEAVTRCPNKSCFSVQRRNLEHFVSKSAFDMAGIGPKILDRLIDEGLIKNFADLFDLKVGDVEGLERFGEKSAVNIIQTIQSHKQISLARFLYSLGIRNVGYETAIDLANFIGDWDLLSTVTQVTKEEWESLSNIGPVVAENLAKFFREPTNFNLIKDLIANGVKIEKPIKKVVNKDQVTNKIFVFTGTLATMTRDSAKERARNLGGIISESVSRQTDYLVVGSEPGSKLAKANSLGVKVLNEVEYLELID